MSQLQTWLQKPKKNGATKIFKMFANAKIISFFVVVQAAHASLGSRCVDCLY